VIKGDFMNNTELKKRRFILPLVIGFSCFGALASEHHHMGGQHDMSQHSMPASHVMSDQHDMSSHHNAKKMVVDKRLKVVDPWIRMAPPIAKNGAAYFVLNNTGTDDITVTGVSTPVSETAAMHDAVEHKGMMTMKHLMVLVVPAGETVEFAPGGKHLMLINLTEKLEVGKEFPVHFMLKNGAMVSAGMVVK